MSRAGDLADGVRAALAPIITHADLTQVSRDDCVYDALRHIKELERLADDAEWLRVAIERGGREGESDLIRAWCYLTLHSREASG